MVELRGSGVRSALCDRAHSDGNPESVGLPRPQDVLPALLAGLQRGRPLHAAVYKLLPLPLGVRALQEVARLAALSEAGVPANRTELSVLESDPRSPFALRPLRAGRGAVYTRRALTRAGLYRLTVRAAAPRHQSVFVLLIAVSPYPY